MAESDLAGRVVLVVDDDANLRRLLEMILGLTGATVVSTDDSDHADRLAAFMQPDLVLLDVDMPGVDGFEVARRLQADPLTRAIPFVFVTGGEDLGVSRVEGSGASGLVKKPFDPALLEDAIAAALRPRVRRR